MEKDAAKMEELIVSRQWEHLTDDEQLFVIRQVGSEDEFRRLQVVNERLTSNAFRSNLEPDGFVLGSLQAAFEKKRQPVLNRVLVFRIPAYWALLLMVASVMLTLVLTPIEKISETPVPLTRAIIQKDTVYLTRTVVQDRVVYRYVKAPAKPILTTLVARETSADSVGVSMNERGALDQLLVSMP